MFLPCEYEYRQESLQKFSANVTKELNLFLTADFQKTAGEFLHTPGSEVPGRSGGGG